MVDGGGFNNAKIVIAIDIEPVVQTAIHPVLLLFLAAFVNQIDKSCHFL